MQLHFIAGLPRSGTTLLASLLRQNPTVMASFESPMGQIVTDAVTSMGSANEAHLFIHDGQKHKMLRALFDAYYAGWDTVFDNNRRWLANVALLHDLFPESKIICLVRSPVEIIDSFERLFRAHPLSTSVITGSMANKTVYGRTDDIMASGGVLGFAWAALKDAFFGPHAKKLFLLEYNDLAESPGAVMKEIETVCELTPWEYDFNKVQPLPSTAKFDEQLGTPDLHALGPIVQRTHHKCILPPDLQKALPSPFWR